jgi:hypothetical protein
MPTDHQPTNPSIRRYEIVDMDVDIIGDPEGGGNYDHQVLSSRSNNTEDHPPPPPPADVSTIVDPEATEQSDNQVAGSTSNNSDFDHLPPPPPPTLPTGQIIDGKNTLQSFDSLNISCIPQSFDHLNTSCNPEIIPPRSIAAAAAAADTDIAIEKGRRKAAAEATMQAIAMTLNENAANAAAPPNQPTLPNGEIINAKNIIQSYNVESDNNVPNIPVHPTAVVASNDLDNGPNENLFNHINSNYYTTAAATNETTHETNDTNVPTVHAFAVSSMQLVEAEPITRATRSITFWIMNGLVVFVVAVGATLGVYCGTGNCTSDRGSNSTSANVGNSTSDNVGNSTSSDNVGGSTSSDNDGNSTSSMNTMMLLEFIDNITFSNQGITVNGTNPESQAVAWMLNNNELFNITSLSSITNNTASFYVRQLYPLLTMWFQQTETSQWINVKGWLNDPDECTWYGVSCQSIDMGDDIGVQNVVVGIDFYNVDDGFVNNIVGTIPADLGLLTKLEHFDLYGNELTGTLPESIGQWTALTTFDVGVNALTGTLSASIGQWTALTYLCVTMNALTGTLPASIGQWTVLPYFDGSFNKLTGTLPSSMGQWTALTYFDVGGNVLTGTLPTSIGQWTALTYFAIFSMGLTGTLHASIGQWTALKYFNVRKNALTGTLPASIDNWSQIQSAYFEQNQFTGTMPIGICNYTVPGDSLVADCKSEINCTCCTLCY